MKYFFSVLLVAGSSLLAPLPAPAQTTFRLGPTAGYSLSSASFQVADYPDYFTTTHAYHGGLQGGVLAQVAFGGHFAVQPAVLYAHQAPGFGTSSYYPPGNYSTRQEYTLALNYLSVALPLLVSQRASGRGAQVFAGPYLGWLLGGTYRNRTGATRGPAVPDQDTDSFSGPVEAGDTYATGSQAGTYRLRRLDAGLQVGVGYGFEALQLQADVSWGLRNIGPAYAPTAAHPYEAPVIRSRGFHLTAAYLFERKH